MESCFDRTPISRPSFIMSKSNKMEKESFSIDTVRSFLLSRVDNYVEFVNQVIHDEKFIRRMERLLPFAELSKATMDCPEENQFVKDIGVVIMRMDFFPDLFSLAATVTIEKKNRSPSKNCVFLNACKTIEELQAYVGSESFKKEIIEYINSI